jgi:hypothetical protein
MFWMSRYRFLFLGFIIFFAGCASASLKLPKPETGSSTLKKPMEKVRAELKTVPPRELAPIAPTGTPQDLEEPVIPLGAVFAKTVFDGVVKTSYVQLGIIDLADPEKEYQLYIGDKARQKNFPWRIQTVSPGYFFIELPEGVYRFSSISIPVGSTLAVESLDIRFEVAKEKIYYLGTLFVNGEKERVKVGGVPILKPGFVYSLKVVDDLKEAQAELEKRFPQEKREFSRHLMSPRIESNAEKIE